MKITAACISVAVLSLALSTTAEANDGEALMKKFGCVACHSVDKKGVGPAMKDIAAKYASDKTATDKLAAKVLAGGSGVWGAMPMPAHKGRVSDAEAKAMVQWVLSRK